MARKVWRKHSPTYLNRWGNRRPKSSDLLKVTPLANDKISQQSLNMQEYSEHGKSLLHAVSLGLKPVPAASVSVPEDEIKSTFYMENFFLPSLYARLT